MLNVTSAFYAKIKLSFCIIIITFTYNTYICLKIKQQNEYGQNICYTKYRRTSIASDGILRKNVISHGTGHPNHRRHTHHHSSRQDNLQYIQGKKILTLRQTTGHDEQKNRRRKKNCRGHDKALLQKKRRQQEPLSLMQRTSGICQRKTRQMPVWRKQKSMPEMYGTLLQARHAQQDKGSHEIRRTTHDNLPSDHGNTPPHKKPKIIFTTTNHKTKYQQA